MFLSCYRMPNHSQRRAEANRGSPRCANGFLPDYGPLVSCARSGLIVRWRMPFHSLRRTCAVVVSNGVCPICENGVVSGRVGYRPDPVASNGREHVARRLHGVQHWRRLGRRRNATLRQLDIDSFAKLPPGGRGDADKPCSVANCVRNVFEGRAEVSARRASVMLSVADAECALLRPATAQISVRCVHVTEVRTLNQTGSFVPSISTRSGGSSQS
jgi:hypothetical protein